MEYVNFRCSFRVLLFEITVELLSLLESRVIRKLYLVVSC